MQCEPGAMRATDMALCGAVEQARPRAQLPLAPPQCQLCACRELHRQADVRRRSLLLGSDRYGLPRHPVHLETPFSRV